MAVGSTTSQGSLIKTFVDPELINSVWQNADFLKHFTKNVGPGLNGVHHGTAVKINAEVSQNTGVAACAENGSFEAVGAAGFQQGSFAFTTIYGTFGYYDELKRSLGGGLAGSYHSIDAEKVDTLGAVIDLMETTMMADAATGLLGMVDDDTTAWGGVNRGTYATLKSVVTAGGSAQLSEAMLSNTYFDGRAAEHGIKRYDLILSEQTQQKAYDQLIVASPTLNAPVVGDASYANYSYKMIPWLDVADFVNSEIVFLSGVTDGSGVAVYDHNYWDTSFYGDENEVDFMPVNYGPDAGQTLMLGLIEVAKTAPSQTRAWSLSAALVVRKPHKQCKIEALAISW